MRSTTTSMSCFSFLSSFGGSSSSWYSPSTFTRAKPRFSSSANSLRYSPLRPRIIGASRWKRAPSPSAIALSTIWLTVCALDGQAGGGRIGNADARPEQAHVVVDLGDGADGRARVAGGGLLLDRDGGREAVDALDVRLLHQLEELAGVGGERFHVAALALGVDRVERQRGFARAGQAGDHHQLVPRNIHVDVLQIVFACAADADGLRL